MSLYKIIDICLSHHNIGRSAAFRFGHSNRVLAGSNERRHPDATEWRPRMIETSKLFKPAAKLNHQLLRVCFSALHASTGHRRSIRNSCFSNRTEHRSRALSIASYCLTLYRHNGTPSSGTHSNAPIRSAHQSQLVVCTKVSRRACRQT